MPDHAHEQQQLDAHTTSVTHLIRVLRAYLPAMALVLAVVATLWVLVAAAIYILAPSSHVTSLRFRLEFEGADEGRYPNGMKFAGTEIVNTPVLLKTFNDNDLGRFTTFPEFSTSVFVLQSNPAMEQLQREYQARLADMRLTAVDRERIQREYEMRLASVSKDQFAIHYVRKSRGDKVPKAIAVKILHDILKNWADFVTREQHVLEYRIAVLSPDVVAGVGGGTNPIIDAIMLRDKVLRLRDNVERISSLPAADLARTSDGLTLTDLRVNLDDVVRYRLDPLVNGMATSTLDDRAETIRFLETQLANDERALEGQNQRIAAIQQTLAIYTNPRQNKASAESESSVPGGERSPEGDAVTPQLSNTFIDRLMEITADSTDSSYRQDLANEYRTESLELGPIQLAVSYDRTLLEFVRGAARGGGIDASTAASSIARSRQEIRNIAVKVHEIHRDLSRALSPATQLVTTSASSSRVERTVSLKRLGLYGFLLLALALPVVVIVSLIHNHMRDEEDEEERLAATIK